MNGRVTSNYKVGDKVVYPHHGAGKVLKKEKKEVLGEVREYLTIKILHNDMTVMVPTDSADRAGLRRVIGESAVERVLSVLRDDISQMPKNWNRRFKHNRDKMKTGDIYELAEVVRNLAIRDFEKGLSTGEKQMFTRAKKILSSELMYALDMDEEEAEEYLDKLLEETNEERAAAASSHARGSRSAAGSPHWSPRLAAGSASAADVPKALVRARRAGRWWPGASRRWRARRRRRRGDRRAARLRARDLARGRRRGGAGPADDGRDRRPEPLGVGRQRARGCAGEAAVVVVHDAARPLVTPELVDRCVGAARALGLRRRVAAARATDTIKEADAGGRVIGDARPLQPVGGPDAAGLPGRGAAQARSPAQPTRRAPTTTRSWSRRPAATCGSSRRRETISRSRRRPTFGSRSCCCAGEARG